MVITGIQSARYAAIAEATMADCAAKHLKEIRRGLLESGNPPKEQRDLSGPGSSHEQPQANRMFRRKLCAPVCVGEHSHAPGNKDFHTVKSHC